MKWINRSAALILCWCWCLAGYSQPAFLYYPIPEPPTNAWTSYSIPLVENSDWHLGSPDGPTPTQSEFLAVLTSLNGLTVRFDATIQLFFDNVSLAGSANSTFPACSSDGWMIGDNAAGDCNSILGNPAGSINNGGIPAVFESPAKFLGDQTSAYGGNLNFDMSENSYQAPIGHGGYVVLMELPNPEPAPTSVAAWGDDYSGQIDVAAGSSNIVGIAGGRYHSLVLKTDGTVATSGWNTYPAPDFVLTHGTLPNPTLTNVPPDATNVIAVASGAYHNLALKADSTVIAWGENSYGQATVPPGLTNIVAIAAGNYHSLALGSDGRVFGWGPTNTHVEVGQTNGLPPNYGQSKIPGGLSNVVAIAGGGLHSLALKADGTVVAWGKNNLGQTNVPSGLTNVVAIAAGTDHSLALRADGTVVAWGSNSGGQTNVPTGLSNVIAIAAGSFFSLALKSDGTVAAWGDNAFRQTNAPPELTNIIAIAAGGYHSLALVGPGPPLTHAAPTDVKLDSNGFSASLPTQSGRVYALEYKTSLSDPNWTRLPLVAGTGAETILTDPSPANTQRFYRVSQW